MLMPLVIPVSNGSSFYKFTLIEYIAEFKDLAVTEMNRSGVPASITMSQGILESAFGNSTLALMANNHFGINNKPDWKGETYSMGSSCYKKYNSVFESFQDHSNHIKSRKWYADLFKLNHTDYKNWAHGLKKAGYAQDPNYAWSLISLIEKYKLNELDKLYVSGDTIK
jgi:flagellum-specific peptidoglycan hydrolase FlgJ